jgi:hypothetical protein
MSRFKTGDTARLNFRASKAYRYGQKGRLAICTEYLGGGLWKVEDQTTGKARKWFTADMDNVTDLVAHKATVDSIKELVGA